MILQNWLVVGPKGLAAFLEQNRADEYVVKYGGVIHHMVPSSDRENPSVQETSRISVDIRQERTPTLTRNQFLSENTPTDGEVQCSSGTTCESVSACGDSSPSETQGLEQSPSYGDNSIQCSWCPGECETVCLLHPFDQTNGNTTC